MSRSQVAGELGTSEARLRYLERTRLLPDFGSVDARAYAAVAKVLLAARVTLSMAEVREGMMGQGTSTFIKLAEERAKEKKILFSAAMSEIALEQPELEAAYRGEHPHGSDALNLRRQADKLMLRDLRAPQGGDDSMKRGGKVGWRWLRVTRKNELTEVQGHDWLKVLIFLARGFKPAELDVLVSDREGNRVELSDVDFDGLEVQAQGYYR